MRLSAVLRPNPDLPTFAWMIELTPQRTVFEHGTGVEADEGYLVEGAWSESVPAGFCRRPDVCWNRSQGRNWGC